jgi:hypothetical protein
MNAALSSTLGRLLLWTSSAPGAMPDARLPRREEHAASSQARLLVLVRSHRAPRRLPDWWSWSARQVLSASPISHRERWSPAGTWSGTVAASSASANRSRTTSARLAGGTSHRPRAGRCAPAGRGQYSSRARRRPLAAPDRRGGPDSRPKASARFWRDGERSTAELALSAPDQRANRGAAGPINWRIGSTASDQSSYPFRPAARAPTAVQPLRRGAVGPLTYL